VASGRSSKGKFTRAFMRRAVGTSVLKVSFSHGKMIVKVNMHGSSCVPALPRVGVRLSTLLHLLKPASGAAALRSKAGQVRQGAFVQEAFWMVVYYPSFSLRIHAKLAPRASDGSSTRWSSSYRLIVILRAEASIIRVVLDESKAINHRKTQQMKFAKK
jgi:hypothetical protein